MPKSALGRPRGRYGAADEVARLSPGCPTSAYDATSGWGRGMLYGA